tara:strand:- start:88 stop:198 length:111 start_codon:yes stop_codon:yes gene_type:complete
LAEPVKRASPDDQQGLPVELDAGVEALEAKYGRLDG